MIRDPSQEEIRPDFRHNRNGCPLRNEAGMSEVIPTRAMPPVRLSRCARQMEAEDDRRLLRISTRQTRRSPSPQTPSNLCPSLSRPLDFSNFFQKVAEKEYSVSAFQDVCSLKRGCRPVRTLNVSPSLRLALQTLSGIDFRPTLSLLPPALSP